MDKPAPPFLPLAFPIILALLLALIFPGPPSAAASAPASGFAAQVDALRDRLSEADIAAILARADALAGSPVLERSFSMAQMAELSAASDRRTSDARSKGEAVRGRLSEADAEKFAMASADMGMSSKMLQELPLLAAAWRLTGREPLRDHLERQLRELVTWKPFQRPGWTLSARKDPLPARGDGVWLATGTLLQALAIMLEILPSDTLPADLDAAVRQRMAEEIRLSFSDWKDEVPWYVKSGKANSNQWVVPASGMLVGAAALGRDRFADAYRLGADSLRRSLTLAGDDGSLNEGYTYGMAWTSFSLLLARHFALQAGDDTFAGQPFFRNFPDWMALNFQPGGNPVNAFDGFNAQRGNRALNDLTRLAGVSGSAPLAWAVRHELGSIRRDFFGLIALGELARAGDWVTPPPTSGLFQRSHMFVWRQSWDRFASGLWVRGGDAEDFHTHHDRGHVNFIVSGIPVLIESGTPGYSSKRKRPDYDSTLGHNVLTLDGDTFPLAAPAPVTVSRNTADGGELAVDLRQVYPKLAEARRDVRWTPRTLHVTDTLAASSGAAPVTPAWRWHFASAEPARIERIDERRYRIGIPAGRIVFPGWIGPWQDPDFPRPEADDILLTAAVTMEIAATAPLTIESITHPDHTLKFRRTENPHTTLVVRTPEAVGNLTVTTTIDVTPPAQP
ncbi:Heparinase II/III-like protein [Opitutaceae bacterium TAV1]|nr:Heparinase II/III-like protein [Opitutaceae bacterium TAV1]